ncbi:MAG: TraX family protein [Hungatella sp.]
MLSGNVLKVFAIVTMCMDHIGAVIIEPLIAQLSQTLDLNSISELQKLQFLQNLDRALRLIGRLAFPIFCFLLVEGFLHTRNVKNYALRLLVFSAISEIPFDLAIQAGWFDPSLQNVYFTLFLGLVALIGIQKYQFTFWKQAVVVAVCFGTAVWLRTDYGAMGVCFIVLLYLLRDHKVQQMIWGSIVICGEMTAPLAFIPIRMYNGTRGKWNLKYLFYTFYPLHLLILWGIRKVCFPGI